MIRPPPFPWTPNIPLFPSLPDEPCRALCGGQPPTNLAENASRDPQLLAQVGRKDLVALSAWMDGVERGLTAAVVITYDRLDRIGSTSGTRQQMTASLLGMWLSRADRYRRIRPKIFVREDLFQASLARFPDASKLEARSVSLEWRVEDLDRVLIKHMANTSEGLKHWIESSSRGIPLTSRDALGWVPPRTLPETGPGSQKHFVDHLAGEMMGSGHKKGHTYRCPLLGVGTINDAITLPTLLVSLLGAIVLLAIYKTITGRRVR